MSEKISLDSSVVIEYESIDIIFFCSNLRLFTNLR